jgi:hypothetical protein
MNHYYSDNDENSPAFLESEVAKGLELSLASSDGHSAVSIGHITAEAPGTDLTAFEDAQRAGEGTQAHILENVCTSKIAVLQRPITTLYF